MTTNSVARPGCVLTLTALLLAPVAVEAQSAVRSREQLQQTLDESAQALRDLVAARNKTPATTANLKDKRGLTLKDDLQQNVMLPETQERLEALQVSAKKDLKAGDLPGAQINIGTMRQGLATEIERYTAISFYWRDIGWKVPSDRAVSAESPDAKEIQSLYALLDQQIAARDFVTAMRTTWPKLDELQTRARREEDQRLLASVDAGDLQPLRSVGPGQRKCPPTMKTSGSDKPTFRTAQFPESVNYYPGPDRPSGPANQSIQLFVVVNTEGCAERVFLIKGAEKSEFDEGALRLAADGTYFPAEKDGKAVRAGMTYRIKF